MKTVALSVLCVVALAVLCAPGASASLAPIILVHGFAGWGPDELAGILYWGFFSDTQQQLRDEGFDVHTAVVGPFSSNHDRAVELYANIKGGQADYGVVHSAEFNHARHGRTFDGLYPEWGTPDPTTGKIRKVHLVTHSMGGNTARMLVHLLRNGLPAEVAGTPDGDGLSPLFEGGHIGWIESIVTVATPHDGTTLAMANNFIALVQTFLVSLAAFLGLKPENTVYDMKMDHFGLRREPDEGFFEYLDKVFASPIWDPSFKDLSPYDLSPNASRDFNRDHPADPEVYYFTYTNKATNPVPITHFHIPQATMIPIFWPFATFMGSKTTRRPGEDDVVIDKEWFANDGVVNFISQRGPVQGSNDVVVNIEDATEIVPGVFHYMGEAARDDHANVIGLLKKVKTFYLGIAEMLATLPDDASIATTPDIIIAPPLDDEDDDDTAVEVDTCVFLYQFHSSCLVQAPTLSVDDCELLWNTHFADDYDMSSCNCQDTIYFAEDAGVCEDAKVATAAYNAGLSDDSDDDDVVDDSVDEDDDDDDDDNVNGSGGAGQVVISTGILATMYVTLRMLL